MNRFIDWSQKQWLDLIFVLQNPRQDPDKTVLVLAFFVIFVLFIFVVVLAVIALIKARLRRDEEAEEDFVPEEETPRASLTTAERWGGTLVIGLIVLAAVSYGTTYTARPSFCANCHSMKPSYASWKESSHRKITCNACHARPGATGYFIRQLALLRESAVQVTKGRPSLEVFVANSSCLRCHKELAGKTVKTATIKISHAEILEAGALCMECHAIHSETKKTQMAQCVTCHNGTDAPAECATCHIKDIAARPKPKRIHVKLYVPRMTRCDGCHSIDRCTTHHGTEMPHQPGWLQVHGKIAGASNNPFCWRCHNSERYDSCRICHSVIPPHDVKSPRPNWFDEHKFVVRGEKQSAIRFCDVCHSTLFCWGCHGEDAGRLFKLIRKS